VEYLLAAVEFVADHGRAFVPLYRLSWDDGVWRHIERPVPDIEPIDLTVAALEEAAQSFSVGDHESPMSEQQLLAERAGYVAEARALARRLQARWDAEPVTWRAPTGHPEIDELVWFDYVHTDALPSGDSQRKVAG
jgi:hypothetical protein